MTTPDYPMVMHFSGEEVRIGEDKAKREELSEIVQTGWKEGWVSCDVEPEAASGRSEEHEQLHYLKRGDACGSGEERRDEYLAARREEYVRERAYRAQHE